MKILKPIFFLSLIIALVSGCSRPGTPEEKASWFFDKGETMVISSLEKQDAPEAKVKAAQIVIVQHRDQVNQALASYINVHQDVMQAIVGGKTASDLVSAENKAHEEHIKVLNALGKMHDELETTVGKEVWLAASKQRMEKFNKHFK